jgi:CRP/FNR family transcriptional regulator, cyclic AMP receptor protein
MFNNIPLFEGLPEDDLRAISQHAITKTFPKNTVVIHEGDVSDSLYVIIAGRVKVFLSDEEGKEVILNTQGTGEYFGELALIDEAPRSASVMTLEDTKLSIISKRDFEACLARYPQIALQVIKGLTQRLRNLTENVKSLALMDVYGRVARTLLNLAVEQDGKLMVAQKLTQRDIANMIGASREMVSRILKDLAVGGYISVDKKHIVINEKLPSAW